MPDEDFVRHQPMCPLRLMGPPTRENYSVKKPPNPELKINVIPDLETMRGTEPVHILETDEGSIRVELGYDYEYGMPV